MACVTCSSVLHKLKNCKVYIFLVSLFYNEFIYNYSYFIDVCLSPMMVLIDNLPSLTGPFFVVICWTVISLITIISYSIGLPYWWNISPAFTMFLLIVGNWLLANCAFHYYMGVNCKPGYPPQNVFMSSVANICKKCIAPKPFRTHHCSQCNTCVLLMDHHCPWMNNCVGYRNRRYFYQFVVSCMSACLFLIVFGVGIAYEQVWCYEEDLFGTILSKGEEQVPLITSEKERRATFERRAKYIRSEAVLFTAVVCVAAVIALGILIYQHGRNISRGETCVEVAINAGYREDSRKINSEYKHPYDFGAKKNWHLFFGIYFNSGRTWWHVLFPSTHAPFGDGLSWPTVTSDEAEWQQFLHPKSA